MKFPMKIKSKLMDFEHPPKVSVLVFFDALFICLTLLIYALFQHVLPSHFFENLKANSNITAESADIDVTDVEPIADVVIPSPTPQSEDSGEITLQEKFKEHFTEQVVLTNNSYKSPNVSVEIQEYSDGNVYNAQHWYVADIYVSDIHCLQTYMHADNDLSSSSVGGHIRSLSKAAGSVVAINGDYALTTDSGVIIRNGEVIRDEPALAQIGVIFEDGTMECYTAGEYNSQDVIERGAWQAWTFGPSLLDNKGKAYEEFPTSYGQVLEYNPRTVIGYYEPGHYCFVVIDGRQSGYAIGYDMVGTAKIMEDLGCKVAFNLDGGRSSQMTFSTNYVNIPYKDGRYVGDIVFIKDIFN